MLIRKCDRCGEEIKEGQMCNQIKVTYRKFILINITTTKELCDNCYHNFFDYVKGGDTK